MMKTLVLLLTVGALACAQGPSPFGEGNHRPDPFLGGPGGKWWSNPDMIRRLGLSADQQKKMDDILQQSRLRLIDLNAALEKEEVVMEGLMRGPQLDDSRILPAIERIAQARAELEKANARLMLGIRHTLTPEQWETLNRQAPPHRMGPGGPRPHPHD